MKAKAFRFAFLTVCAVATGLFAGPARAERNLYVYTSMKESMIGHLKAEFLKRNPDVKMDAQSAGAGKLMAKIAAERESGKILADVLWTSEVPDFYQLKQEGLLLPFIPKDIAALHNPFPDYDGSFTAVRLGTLGIAYNTRFVKNPPKSWNDLKGADFKGAFGVANPALSGTAYMSVAALVNAFGWQYFEDLRGNRAKMAQGSGQVVDDTASGDLKGSLAVDYITIDKMQKGATLALAYPPEMLIIPSPIGIFKNSPNQDAAKAFIDFVLSKDGQAIIAAEGTLPVRDDVPLLQGFNLPTVAEAVKRALPLDYPKMMAEKEATVKKFAEIMQKK